MSLKFSVISWDIWKSHTLCNAFSVPCISAWGDNFILQAFILHLYIIHSTHCQLFHRKKRFFLASVWIEHIFVGCYGKFWSQLYKKMGCKYSFYFVDFLSVNVVLMNFHFKSGIILVFGIIDYLVFPQYQQFCQKLAKNILHLD